MANRYTSPAIAAFRWWGLDKAVGTLGKVGGILLLRQEMTIQTADMTGIADPLVDPVTFRGEGDGGVGLYEVVVAFKPGAAVVRSSLRIGPTFELALLAIGTHGAF